MLMVALIVVVVVVVLLLITALFADRGVKLRKRARLRRDAAERLSAAAAGAEARERDRRSRQQASAALTSVMPTIHERGPRRV
jgi:Flp pilus assembly protein TadB